MFNFDLFNDSKAKVPFQKLVDNKILSLKLGDASVGSIENVELASRKFMDYFRHYKPSVLEDVNELTKEDILELILWLKGSTHKVSYCNSIINKIRSILNLAFEDKLITTNYGKWLKAQKVIDDDKEEIITKEEYVEMKKNCNTRRFSGVNKMVVLTLFWNLPSRLNEITKLEIGDINFSERCLTVTAVKTSKRITLPLNEELMKVLSVYIEFTKNVRQTEQLLITSTGQPLSARAIQNYLAQCGDSINKHVHPHLFRHTWITRAVSSGLPLTMIQQMCGHQTLKQISQVYNKYSLEQKHDAIQMMRLHKVDLDI